MVKKTGFGENRSKQKASAQKKNKKKTTGNELEMVVKDGKAAILEEIDTMFGEDGDDLSDRKVKKVFERQFKQLKDALDASNTTMNASHSSRLMTRAMLAMVIDLIPVAEAAYRNSQKEQAAYALNALVNQARELATDLKMMQDVEGQAEFIRDKLLTPTFTSLASQILTSVMSLKNVVDTELGNKAPKTARRLKTELDNTLRGLGEFVEQSNRKAGSDVERYLSGDPTLLGSSKKPKRH